MADRRKEELMKKRQKLEELRRAREERKKSEEPPLPERPQETDKKAELHRLLAELHILPKPHTEGWTNVHPNFTTELQEEWEKRDFSKEQTKEWVNLELEPHEYNFATYLKKKGYQPNTINKEIVAKESWKDVHLDFRYSIRKDWEQQDFNKEETKNWVENSFKPHNHSEAKEWRNSGFDAEQTKKWIELGLDDCFDAKGWIKLGLDYKKTQELIQLGFKPNDYNFVGYLKWRNINFQTVKDDSERLKEEYNQLKEWEEWKNQGFTYKQVQEWINIGAKPNDYDNARAWERKNSSLEQTKKWIEIGFKLSDHSKAEEWKKENFTVEQVVEWISIGFKSQDYGYPRKWEKQGFVLKEVEKWINAGVKPDDYKSVAWFRDTKNLGPDWISNYQDDYQMLSERFKKYGLCFECEQPNTGEKWCQPCNSKHFQQSFSDWTSKNLEIDEFIQKHQLEATETNKLLEWIPYEQFINIEFLAEGGFGKVYKAKWTEGTIYKWSIKDKKWERQGDKKDQKHYSYEKVKTVVLKSLTNTQNITSEFLQEVKNHKVIDDWFNSIVPCYGISQDSQGNYLMVMEYAEGGNLRELLKKSYHNLSFEQKFLRLINIAQGLKDIHQKNLVHRDFHSGNILDNSNKCFITDLGLSKATKEGKDEKVMGVLPYVAPEVLTKKSYSKTSDIYSFGVIATEILTGLPPYHDVPHDEFLTIKICQGLRPNLGKIRIPQLLKNLIEKCWNADPEKRPTASELVKISREWQEEIQNRENTEFYQQYQEVKEFNEKEEKNRVCELLTELYQRYKGKTIKIKPKEDKKAERIKDEVYSEFCQKHNYKRWETEAKKKFNELFTKVSNLNYTIHPSAVYTSRLLDFKNLPKPQNSKEINEEFWSKSLQVTETSRTTEYSNSLEFDFTNLNLENNQDWTNTNSSFNEELTHQWQENNFTLEQVRDWINTGLTPSDHHFASYLRDYKHLTPEEVLNNGNYEQLREEFQTYQEQLAQIETPPK